MDELIEQVPEEFRNRFTVIAALTDGFCDACLNDEYKVLCREMVACMCQKGSPIRRGKPATWAGGIVHAVGWVNCLSDPNQTPHITSAQIAEGMGVSQGTMMEKSRTIRQGLRLMQLDPDWCLPSKIDDNPLVWMQEVNGIIVDLRTAPYEIQQAAFEQGMIPYIPLRNDDDQPGNESGKPARDGIVGRIGF